MTYLADHVNGLSHDAVNRFLCNEKLTARMIWEHVQGDITPSDNGCLVFDDSILDKGHSHCIEMVKLQYSGNAHGLIKGIGMPESVTKKAPPGHPGLSRFFLQICTRIAP